LNANLHEGHFQEERNISPSTLKRHNFFQVAKRLAPRNLRFNSSRVYCLCATSVVHLCHDSTGTHANSATSAWRRRGDPHHRLTGDSRHHCPPFQFGFDRRTDRSKIPFPPPVRHLRRHCLLPEPSPGRGRIPYKPTSGGQGSPSNHSGQPRFGGNSPKAVGLLTQATRVNLFKLANSRCKNPG